jgi:hypothetical protein
MKSWTIGFFHTCFLVVNSLTKLQQNMAASSTKFRVKLGVKLALVNSRHNRKWRMQIAEMCILLTRMLSLEMAPPHLLPANTAIRATSISFSLSAEGRVLPK